jgi:hypothetical protein
MKGINILRSNKKKSQLDKQVHTVMQAPERLRQEECVLKL